MSGLTLAEKRTIIRESDWDGDAGILSVKNLNKFLFDPRFVRWREKYNVKVPSAGLSTANQLTSEGKSVDVVTSFPEQYKQLVHTAINFPGQFCDCDSDPLHKSACFTCKLTAARQKTASSSYQLTADNHVQQKLVFMVLEMQAKRRHCTLSALHGYMAQTPATEAENQSPASPSKDGSEVPVAEVTAVAASLPPRQNPSRQAVVATAISQNLGDIIEGREFNLTTQEQHTMSENTKQSPDTSTSLVFEEPTKSRGKRATVFSTDVQNQLKLHPGRWAVLGHYSYSPGPTASTLRKANPDFEFACRVSHDPHPDHLNDPDKKHFKMFGKFKDVSESEV